MNALILEMTATDIDRFWSKVDVREPNECWPWLGKRCKRGGYGVFSLRGDNDVKAHQIANFLINGWPEDPALYSLHTCDNPPCCNGADHLFYGTHGDNMSDAASKGLIGMQLHPERHHSKLNEKDVHLIRSLVGSNQSELAIKLGVHSSLISRIQSGKAWRYLS